MIASSLSRLLQLPRKSRIIGIFVHNSQKTCNMSGCSKEGLPLKKIVDVLNEYANVSLAGSWDNVGLLIEPTQSKNVSHILLTNDLTEDVMQEAVELQVDMIISYHPPIFAPLKSITTSTWKVCT